MDENDEQGNEGNEGNGDSIGTPSVMELALQFARTDIERLTQERNSLRQRLFSAQDQIVELRTQNVLLNEQNHLLGVEVEKLKKNSTISTIVYDDKTLSMEHRIMLSDKRMIPQLGLGTWQCEPKKVRTMVKEAIFNRGYRLIDAEWIYQHEYEVGNGIHEAIEQSQGRIKREDLFITTKLWNQHHAPEDVEWALRDSLEKLGLDYVDLYLIHWPIAFKNILENVWSQSEDGKTRYFAENVTLADTWKAMEKLVDLKLTRSIGISNFNPSQTDEILKIARIKPAVNQVELHPYLNQKELREYSAKHNIVITSYCPLSNLNRENERAEDVPALYNPVIQEIAKSKHKTTAQIIIRWHLQNGLVVILEPVTIEKLFENSELFDFALSDHEMCQID